MTDPIEAAGELLAYWTDTLGWPDDSRAMVMVRALIAAARADREALRIVSEERDVRRDVCESFRASLAEVESKLAAVTAERDELHRERTEARNEIEALATEGMRLESALAQALAAMPTAEERFALASAYAATVEHATGGCEHRATPTAERELAALREWMRRLDAFRASQAKGETPCE